MWVKCSLLLSAVTANLAGTLHEGGLKHYFTALEQAIVGVKDLYYLKELNPKHVGVDPETTCPNIVREGERDLDLLFYTVQCVMGLEEFKKNPLCKYQLTDADEDLVAEALENPKNVKELYMAIGIEGIRGNAVDPEEAVSMYASLVKEDDSVLAGSLAILGASQLWRANPATDLAPLLKVVDIPDMFAQADSFDKQLSFDGDVMTTANFLKAAIAIGDYNGNFPLSADQVVGFGNFVAKGFRPSTASDLFHMISMIMDLKLNKYSQPIHVKLISRKPFHNVEFQPLVVALYAIDGTVVKDCDVTARSITRLADNEVIFSNVKFNLHAPRDDKGKEKDFSTESIYDAVFEYKFMDSEPKAGFYDVELEVAGKGAPYALSEDAIRFKFKVTKAAEIADVRVGLGSKDKSVDTMWHENKLPEDVVPSIGRSGRVHFEFKVVDSKTKESVNAHQAFVSIRNVVNSHTVTFIAEEKKGKYSAQFDVSEHLEFGGKHTLNIFVGDVLIQTGQLDALVGVLQVDGNTEPESAIYATKYLDRYRTLTPIFHTFKQPEERPSFMISLVFTGACAIPLLGLLIAWGRLGVNVNRMENAFLPFHMSIASVFGLYFMYWLKFNMFTTLKWLALLGSVTFILGNRVLSALAVKEK